MTSIFKIDLGKRFYLKIRSTEQDVSLLTALQDCLVNTLIHGCSCSDNKTVVRYFYSTRVFIPSNA